MTFDRNARDRKAWSRNVCGRKACLAAAALASAALAAGIVAAAPAGAHPIHHLYAGYLFPCATVDRIGDGTFQYRGGCELAAFRSRRHRHAARWR
jgi:hypothetical protein